MQQFFARLALRRLGTLFVERDNVADSRADAQSVIAAARQGHVLVFFPEGTFTRRAGLAGFFLGAFTVAAEAELPVVPGVIRGTRSMLRGDQWFPRRASLSLEILEPIASTGLDFASVLRMRDQARAAMLARCGEPDLDELTKPALTG